MRLLVGCECSGRVRDAFLAFGVDAVSCDLVPSDYPGPHIVGDVLDVLAWGGFDCLIAFPPCTYLSVSGARWMALPERQEPMRLALEFVFQLRDCGLPFCLENPVSILSTRWRKPDQIIQPWQFGDGYVKRTCLWLRGFPLLVPSCVVPGRVPWSYCLPPSPDRAYLRSLTYPGIAAAMAAQWSTVILEGGLHG